MSSDLSNSFFSSVKPRLTRKVSSSFDSLSSVVRHRVFYTTDTFDGSHSQHSLPDTRTVVGGDETTKTQSSVNHFDSPGYGSEPDQNERNDRGQKQARGQSARTRLTADEGKPAVEQHRSLTAIQDLDAFIAPLDQSSRRTTIFIGPQSQQGQPTSPRLEGTHRASVVSCSKMHRTVDKDDYLLARGANPRTGVVTPGLHSASSSVDDDDDAGINGKTSTPQNRWRQRGDQWISLDLGQATPSSTSPSAGLPDHPSRPLRIPPKISPPKVDLASTRVDSASLERNVTENPGVITANHHPRQRSHALGTYSEISQDDIGWTGSQGNVRVEQTVRRKPVGSPPSRSGADQNSRGQDGTTASNETVLRKLRFAGDLRSSSAPDPRMHANAPKPLPREPPSVPAASAFLMNQSQPLPADKAFLGPQPMSAPASDPNSKLSNISGRPTIEKELPCLPMNSGPSLSTQDLTPSQTHPRDEDKANREDLLMSRAVPPQGPRGGDPAYPFIRSTRPTHPPLQTARTNVLLGERMMPIPVYDNPPRRPLPLMRMAGPTAGGPRTMPIQEVRGLKPTSEDAHPSWNTTTIPTSISTNRFLSPPRPLQVGPRPLRPDPQIRNHGRLGFPQRPAPLSESDIIMNTGMSMNTDPMMSIPLPRTRPRAMTRPPMPTRAEGMYGVPMVRPSRIRQNPEVLEYHQPLRGPTSGPVGREEIPLVEASLIPEPLRFRAPTNPTAHTFNDSQLDHGEARSSGLGLMRKCSRCHHGFVDVKLHNTDSVIHTSDLQRDTAEASEGSKRSHPTGRSLPGLPEEERADTSVDVLEPVSKATSKKTVQAIDDRDHDICCPDCCKEDCHEGCLGHPSPRSTPSPTKSPSIWSDAPTPSSASESDGWGEHSEKNSDKGRFTGLELVKLAFKRSPKKDSSKSSQGFKMSGGNIGQPGTSLSNPRNANMNSINGALAAALTATGSTPTNTTKGAHRRQRSSSSPVIGQASYNLSADQGDRAVSGSRLRVPTPAGLAIRCSGISGSRNVSGTSMATLELQIPGFGSLGGNAVGEMVMVPFEATKMWIKNHPQVMTMGWYVLERGWAMSQIMMTTGWKLWAMVFVYSKTGKLKFQVGKGETAGGFVIDCARSMLYLLLFAAVSMFVVRLLRVILGVVGIVGLLFKAVFWLLKGILGVNVVR